MSITIGSTKIGLKPLPDYDDEPEELMPLFDDDNGGCMSGDSLKQVFWYVPMGNGNFGIHMNAEEFEKRQPYLKIFREGVSHEYFHHIVDCWCVINEVDRSDLDKQYENQSGKEWRKGEYLRIEEAMANQLAFRWIKNELCPSTGIYSFWPPFSSPDVWFKGSLIVALQYIAGDYHIDGLTPEEGYSIKAIEEIEVSKEWIDKIPDCEFFLLDGENPGFKTHHDIGVWSFKKIPFHVHHTDKVRQQYYSKWKDEFIEHLLGEEE